MDITKKKLKRILVITLSNFGDVILTVPVIAALRQAFARATLDVMVGEKAYELLRDSALLQEVMLYDKRASWRRKLRLVMKLRANTYDYVIDMRNTLIPLLIGAPSNSLQLNYKMRKINSRYERYRSLLVELGLPQPEMSRFPLYAGSDGDAVMKKIKSAGFFTLQNIAVISPGARLPLKRWPARHFARLANMINAECPMCFVIVGDSFDQDVCDEVVSHLETEAVINLCGKISQKELAFIVERARLVLSNDSAIMHLGNLYRRPTVGFFGPSDASKYGYGGETARIIRRGLECQPCNQSQCDKSQICLQGLDPVEVYPVVKELL